MPEFHLTLVREAKSCHNSCLIPECFVCKKSDYSIVVNGAYFLKKFSNPKLVTDDRVSKTSFSFSMDEYDQYVESFMDDMLIEKKECPSFEVSETSDLYQAVIEGDQFKKQYVDTYEQFETSMLTIENDKIKQERSKVKLSIYKTYLLNSVNKVEVDNQYDEIMERLEDSMTFIKKGPDSKSR